MNRMTLYVDKESPIHRVDPLTKLLFVAVSVASSYLANSLVPVLCIVSVSMALLCIGRVFRHALPLIGVSIILIASILVVQGLFHPSGQTALFDIGPVTIYKESISIALLIALRVVNMITSFAVLILTTKPDDLVEALISQGLSPKFGYILLSVLQIVPQMKMTTGRIMDSQRARGLETDGPLAVRIKSFLPLIGPIVLSSLNETRERSIALEIRGFSAAGRKTRLRQAVPYRHAAALRVLLCAGLLCAIAWRFAI